jgi:hypothetical protein
MCANIPLVGLKGDFEVRVPWVYGGFLNFRIFDVITKEFTNITDAVGYVISIALNYHLNCAISQIANPPDQLITVRYIVSGEAKTDTLDSAAKNYLFGALTHYCLHINLR